MDSTSPWIELSQLGWNVTTIGLVGTAVFTLLSAWSFLDQAKVIWKKRSVEVLAPVWKISYTGLMSTAIAYGIFERKIAIVFHGIVLVLAQLPILWGIHRFNGFTTSQKKIGLAWLLGLFLMLVLPYKPLLYFVYSIFMLPAVLTQSWEFWNNKTVGVVRVQMLWTAWIGTVFWVVYAFAVSDWPISTIGLVNLGIFTLTLALWYYYRARLPT